VVSATVSGSAGKAVFFSALDLNHDAILHDGEHGSVLQAVQCVANSTKRGI